MATKTTNAELRNTSAETVCVEMFITLFRSMTLSSKNPIAVRTAVTSVLEKMPEDKVVFILQIMQGVNGLYTDNKPEREEAFAQLELLRKKGTVSDDDAELASYRDAKYGN